MITNKTIRLVLPLLLLSWGNLWAQVTPGLLFKSGFEPVPELEYPTIRAAYEAEYELLPPMSIPAPMQPAMDAIEEVFADPGIAFLRIMAIAVDGAEYASSGSYAVFFQTCAGPGDPGPECDYAGDIVPTIQGVIASEIVESIADDGLAQMGLQSSLVDLLSASSVVFENVETFSLGGVLTISQDPDAAGLLGDSNSLVINRITWRWMDSEGQVVLGIQSQYENDAISAAIVIHPRDSETPSLEIAPFDIPLDYARLNFTMVEKLAFPLAFGPSIDSLSDFYTYLIDCETLASQLESETGTPSAVTLGVCEALSNESAAAVEEWLSVSAPDLFAYLLLQTPASDPCPIVFESEAVEPTVTGLGGQESASRCKLEAAMVNEDPPHSTPMQGTWWGMRLPD